MVKKIINTGTEGNDATGDPIREAFTKTNENFTELYSFIGKGDGLPFTSLSDYDSNRGGELVPNSLFVVNNAGNTILAKTLEGNGIEIDLSDPDKIKLKNLGAKLVYDEAPALGGNLNAQNKLIYNLKDVTAADLTGLGISEKSFVATRGYVGSNFVEVSGDTMRGALNVPAGATGTQVPQRGEVVGKAGDTMTGPLILSRNPLPIDDTDYAGLIAATKNYVDTNAFSSQVNLFVSTSSGNDFRFDVPEEKRGSALAYAFKTINRACFKAEQLIRNSEIELGPYQKPIFFNNGTGISKVVSVPSSLGNNTYRLTITNNGGNGTDMRGTSQVATATIDVRAGLLIRGTSSGAIAMITSIDQTIYSGVTLDGVVYGGTEKYDVKYKKFTDADKLLPVEFIVGEPLEYSDGIQKLNISIFVESGEYFEHLPIRVPANVTIVGDDTRRVIIKPKTGPSGSIWSDIYFRRDITIDGLKVLTPVTAGNFVVNQKYTINDPGTTTNWTSIGAAATTEGTSFIATDVGSGNGTAYCEFGYHYLKDPSKRLYNNTGVNPIDTYSIGGFINAQKALNNNKSFLQTELLAYVNNRYSYAQRDVGSIIDAIGFDLIYGGYSRTLEAAMAFFTNVNVLKLITGAELTNTGELIDRLGILIQNVINQDPITSQSSNGTPYTNFDTNDIEGAYDLAVQGLIRLFQDIIKKDTLVNFPKDNNELDVFLLNDANRIRTVSVQSHGGFMAVLDPIGQIITKSPYVFQCSSFSKSKNKQQFAGGMFVDAFTGNLSCKILERLSPTTLKVGNLIYRTPTNIPISFVLNGVRFEVDYIDKLDGYTNGQYILYINSYTPDSTSYTTSTNPILTQNTIIELETAGNRSMLCSDFTQINDLGYGIMATNGSFIEAVSIFTYYCYRGFFSLNGSQIRSLNGSCAYGTYALSAEGSDPTEVATTANLKYPMVQILTSYSLDTLSTKNKEKDLILYVKIKLDLSINYKPFASSELEIYHSGLGKFGRYFVSNASEVGISLDAGTSTVYALNLSTSGNSNTLTTGLMANVNDGTSVIVRTLRNFDVVHLPIINPTRPSTALQFNVESDIYHLTAYTPITQTIVATAVNTTGVITVAAGSTVGFKAGEQIKFEGTGFGGLDTTTIYYIISYTNTTITLGTVSLGAITTTNGSGSLTGTVGGGTTKDLAATLTIDSNYNYVTLTPRNGTAGATSIQIEKLGTTDSDRIVGMIFAWGSYLHKITVYTPSTSYGTITFTNLNGGSGLNIDTNPATYPDNAPVLKAGLNNVTISNAQIGLTLISEISVMRASSHDLVDIGTGGFANSNIPANIYGGPAVAKAQANEVREIGRGRVFYSTTDQDGNFRVGRYFQVDQGTGSVSFSASIAISNLDGIGFSRGGVTVKEFSADDTMFNQSPDTVPTQLAVVGYVNKRLGLTYPGNTTTVGRLGPGFMPLNGTAAATASMDLGNNKIINLADPSSNNDATTKSYVDGFFKRSRGGGTGIRDGIEGFVLSSTTQFTVYSISRIGAIVISSVARNNTTSIATVTTATSHGYSTGNTVVMSGTTITGFDTTAIITVTSPTVFTYSNAGATVTTISTPNTAKVILNTSATITLLNDASTSGSHGLSVGSVVTITGIYDNSPSTLSGFGNGTITVTSVPSATSFTFASNGATVSTRTVDSSTVTTASNIGMNSAKITSLATPTSGNDAANKTYVDAMVATKDQLSELNDVNIPTPTAGQPLSYNGTTSRWVSDQLVNQSKLSMKIAKSFVAKPTGSLTSPGSFIPTKTYIINDLGSTTQTQWNLIAGTSGITYAIGDIFVASVSGLTYGNGTAYENVQENSGLSSFDDANFSLSNGFVSLKDNGVAIAKLATITGGTLLGNTTGNTQTPSTITFASALNAALTSPQAGVVVRGSDATSFTTVNYSTSNTASALVQRDTEGGISITAVSASGAVGGSSVTASAEVKGATLTSSGVVNAKTELQIDGKAVLKYNGTATRMVNQSGETAFEISRVESPAASLTGTFYGLWSLTTGAKLQATYADLAEYYTSDNDYPTGTVVMIGGDQDVTIAKGYGNTAVAGIVSENPAYLMNSTCQGTRVAVALQGRVPCNVIGTIKKGDLLIASQINGVATSSKDPKPGSIIGKALSDYDSDRIGMIEVLVGKH